VAAAVVVIEAGVSYRDSGPTGITTPPIPSRARVEYAALPIRFEPNVGQAPVSMEYLARAGNFSLGLSKDGALLRLVQGRRNDVDAGRRASAAASLSATDGSVQLRLSWVRALPRPTLQPERKQGSVSNYFIGNDPSRWRRNLANYGAVRYEEIYRGVDWVVYGNPQQLEYDLVVAPHADPQQITLKIEGAEQLSLDGNGDLLIKSKSQTLRQRKPVSYQTGSNGDRVMVGVHYVLDEKHDEVTLALADYDRNHQLVIDPVLAYSTYAGGSADDYAEAIAVDGSSNAYIAGYTASSNFPTASAEQSKNAGGSATDSVCACDAFISKLSADGGTLVYSTYLGGTQDDYAQAIAVDNDGNAYVAGYTGSTDFPTADAEQSSNAGGADAFVVKLSADGSKLVYSTYLGGTQADIAQGIAVDSKGSAYVTGYTTSTNFPTAPTTSTLPLLPPTSNAEQTANAGGYDAFVAKFSADGGTLTYSTYLGGSGDDYGYAIAVDSAGSCYVTGDTTSTDFPTVKPEQRANQDNYDSFVAKFDAAGTALTYSTYLGGRENDHARAIAVDSGGSAYVGGSTVSTDFPTSSPEQGVNAGDYDGFLSKLSADGSKLVYSTYLGGSGDDYVSAIALDSAGNVYATGYTASGDFPTVSPLQQAYAGGLYDAFVTELTADGAALAYSSYVGGSKDDYGTAVAVDRSGNIYLAGYTTSTDFPTVRPEQSTNAGGNDAFVMKVVSGNSAGGTSGGSTGGSNSQNQPTAAVTATPSAGAAPLAVSFDASASMAYGTGNSISFYTFSFGDGSVVNSTSPRLSHTYSLTGTFTATVNVTDSQGNISATPATTSITVSTGPIATGRLSGGSIGLSTLITLLGFAMRRRWTLVRY
jgi:hypothetical protein